MRNIFSRGAGLIEVAIAVSIIAIFIVGIFIAFRQYLTVGLGNTAKVQAAYYAQEGIEVARAMRDSSWSSFSALSTTSTYYLAQVNGVWATSSSATTTLQGFIRTMKLYPVYRATSGDDIVAATSGVSKYLDSNARQVNIQVSWIGTSRATTSIELTTYLTKLF